MGAALPKVKGIGAHWNRIAPEILLFAMEAKVYSWEGRKVQAAWIGKVENILLQNKGDLRTSLSYHFNKIMAKNTRCRSEISKHHGDLAAEICQALL